MFGSIAVLPSDVMRIIYDKLEALILVRIEEYYSCDCNSIWGLHGVEGRSQDLWNYWTRKFRILWTWWVVLTLTNEESSKKRKRMKCEYDIGIFFKAQKKMKVNITSDEDPDGRRWFALHKGQNVGVYESWEDLKINSGWENNDRAIDFRYFVDEEKAAKYARGGFKGLESSGSSSSDFEFDLEFF